MKLPRGRYARFECGIEQFEQDISVQQGNGTSFKEHHLGARKKLFVYDRLVSTTASTNRLELGKLTKGKFIAFLGRFQKQLYRRFRTIETLYDIDIEFTGISRGRNDEVWNAMKVGQTFYNIDFRSAYWQIGHKLGYIDYQFFKDYMDDDLFKSAKRYCFSFLARKNYMIYHTPKGKIEIKCDTAILNKAYENVRKQLYNEVAKAKDGCEGVVEWNIDGVSVLSKDLDTVRDRVKAAGLEYKVTVCRKLSEYKYQYGSREKTYKRPL